VFHFNTCIARIIHDLYCTVVITISVLCRCCLILFILQKKYLYRLITVLRIVCSVSTCSSCLKHYLVRSLNIHTFKKFYYKHLYLFVNKGHFKTAKGMVSAVSLKGIQEGQFSVQ